MTDPYSTERLKILSAIKTSAIDSFDSTNRLVMTVVSTLREFKDTGKFAHSEHAIDASIILSDLVSSTEIESLDDIFVKLSPDFRHAFLTALSEHALETDMVWQLFKNKREHLFRYLQSGERPSAALDYYELMQELCRYVLQQDTAKPFGKLPFSVRENTENICRYFFTSRGYNQKFEDDFFFPLYCLHRQRFPAPETDADKMIAALHDVEQAMLYLGKTGDSRAIIILRVAIFSLLTIKRTSLNAFALMRKLQDSHYNRIERTQEQLQLDKVGGLHYIALDGREQLSYMLIAAHAYVIISVDLLKADVQSVDLEKITKSLNFLRKNQGAHGHLYLFSVKAIVDAGMSGILTIENICDVGQSVFPTETPLLLACKRIVPSGIVITDVTEEEADVEALASSVKRLKFTPVGQ